MATKVHMEALSPTMEEGQLVRWLKKEGDPVAEGDVLAEIETDKATMELVARGSGVLRAIGLREGGTAPVGTVIAVIAAAAEDIGGLLPAGAGAPAGVSAAASAATTTGSGAAVPAPATSPPRAPAAPPAAAVRTPEAGPATAPTAGPAEAPASTPAGRIKASPLARRMAAEAGVAIGGVAGSGPGGRVVKRDIEAAAAAPPAAFAAAAVQAGPEVDEIPVTQMRKTIAKRLVTSIGPVPTFYLTIEVDAARLLAARETVNRRLEKDGIKASINDFVVKAVAVALARHPEVNAQWAETVIRRFRRVHVGVAVAVEDGLITPVVKDADRKGIAQIAAEVRELAARGREKRLQPEEYTGSTFSISNLGMFGIDEFTAIINPPESGILAVGQVADKVVAENGQPVVRPRMRMTMSCDHRVVDGATGARFLQTVREFLEEPAMMLM
jgi:pyruvate dehydrogenase E2 component (dihydrolipoamide acetyltransferase)